MKLIRLINNELILSLIGVGMKLSHSNYKALDG